MSYKIFISHASSDKKTGDLFLKTLIELGINRSEIFYSSSYHSGVKLGNDFNKKVKEAMNEAEIVIFLITHNFYHSPYCLNEMGAVWIKDKECIPILIGGLTYENMEGFIDKRHIAFELKSNETYKILDSLQKYINQSIVNKQTIFNKFIKKVYKTQIKANKDSSIINTGDKKNRGNAKFGLIVTARWYINIPHHIEETRGFDKFHILTPSEKDFRKPLQTILIDKTEKDEKEKQIYFLIELNSDYVIYDFKLVRIEADIEYKVYKNIPQVLGVIPEYDTKKIKKIIQQSMPIIANIKTAYPFTLQIPDIEIGTGKMVIEFGFSCDNQNYIQSFEFEIINECLQCASGNYFIQRTYNEPRAVIKDFKIEDF